MKTLKRIQEEGDKHKVYYRYRCEFCGEELVMSADELELVKYKPITKEVETWYMEDGRWKYRPQPEEVSSDPSKDVFRFKCCNCGHLQDVSTEDYWGHHCNRDGDNNIILELDEHQTKDANEFFEQQHKKYKGKMDAMCMVRTYHITEGAVGNLVKVIDNYTHEEKDISHTEDW